MKQVDVVVIGGGISGLHTAYELSKKGVSFKLFEARPRLGGRIYSPASKVADIACDLGPSWFWPGQTAIIKLVIELGFRHQIFEQFSQGDSLYEPMNSTLMRGVSGISMQGSYRIQGGLGMIIDALKVKIQNNSPLDSVSVGTRVRRIELRDHRTIKVVVEGDDDVEATKVVVAMPPRVALQGIDFLPSLSEKRVNALKQVATWMAGHAKMVAIYESPFWREEGLSGDVISQVGPLSEIHDASPVDGEVFSLFGFFATPPQQRHRNKSIMDAKIIGQLTRLFGEKAASPMEIVYKDWARDVLTATDMDQLIPNHHASNLWDSKMEETFNNHLIWSGSESADGRYNGYIEGAISASYFALSQLYDIQ